MIATLVTAGVATIAWAWKATRPEPMQPPAEDYPATLLMPAPDYGHPLTRPLYMHSVPKSS